MNASRSIALLGLAALGGCGGGPSEDVQLGTGATKADRSVVVAALGDSITAGSPSWDPDAAVRDSLGTGVDPESQYPYWAQLRLPHARFRNCGVYGERTDEIARRLEHCAQGAQVLIVQGGINDIVQMRRVKTAARNLRGIVERGRKMGLRVALVEVLPWNNGYPGADHRIRRLNHMIGTMGRELQVPVYPWYRLLEDPSAPGRMRADLTADGDHPSVRGYRRLAGVVELP
jgi:lysophospholipase L1-like esterase